MSMLNKLGVKPTNPGACWGINEWSTSQSESVTSYNPANGEEIAKVYKASDEDYETIISRAEEAFLEWRTIPAPLRGELVRKMGNALRENKDALGSLVSLEMGKSKAEGDGEVQEMIDMADFAVGQSRMLYGNSMHSERPQHRMYEQWQPIGLVGVISAFNFPVAVWSWNSFIAAICGSVTIWKPSSKTPLTAVAVQNICNQVLEKEGYKSIFYMFVGSNKLATKFIEDKRVKKMSFTGSSVIGKMVGVKVAERMGKCLLELAGNNAVIIDETAKLEHAIPAVAFGGVGTAGQRCTSTRRLIVHESIVGKVTESLVNAYKQVTIGDPLDTKNLMGPLIDESAIEDFEKAIEQVKSQGGEVLFGGSRLDRPGHYVQPTLVKAENHWDVVQNETFAPILYIMTFKTIEEAIELNNGVAQGLSSAIFTQNLTNAEKFLSYAGSDCGIANVNIGTSGAEIGGAFGGEKDTGGGREAGSDSWKSYMRRQTNTIFWGDTPTLAQGITFDI